NKIIHLVFTLVLVAAAFTTQQISMKDNHGARLKRAPDHLPGPFVPACLDYCAANPAPLCICNYYGICSNGTLFY
ncbi:unnamed protein product, partial [Rotaria sordida]